MQYLKMLEETVVQKFEEEAGNRRETEKKAILMIEERFSYLKNEIEKEARNRNESMEVFQKLIDVF